MWLPETQIICAVFFVSAAAGIAALLRSTQLFTIRSATTAILNSGLLGVAVAAIGIQWYDIENALLILGVAILAGLGGNKLVELVLAGAVYAIKSKYFHLAEGIEDDAKNKGQHVE